MKIKELIKIEMYSISNYDFFNLSKKFKKYNYRHYFEHIPKYAINSEYGNILEAEYYHQYTAITDPGLNSEKFYALLDIEPLSTLVTDEIGHGDIIEFLPKIDYNTIVDKCIINSLEDIHPVPTYIIIEIEYIEDGEIIVNFNGILDSDFNIQKF